MKREFNKIAVTDDMIETLRQALGTNELGAENLMRRIIEAGGLGMVRAKGSHLSEAQIAAIEKGIPSAEEERQVRMACVSLAAGMCRGSATADETITCAEAMAEYILNGPRVEG